MKLLNAYTMTMTSLGFVNPIGHVCPSGLLL